MVALLTDELNEVTRERDAAVADLQRLEEALRRIHFVAQFDSEPYKIARAALHREKPPQPHDPEPQPTSGPDYHAEHAAWRERQR